MTIDIQPTTIQPTYGNLVYQFSSTAQTTYYKYRYVVDVYINDIKETRLKITPQNNSWGQVDISTIVKNYVSSKPMNEGCTGTTQTPITQAEWGALNEDIQKVYIKVGEEYSTTPEGIITPIEPTTQSTDTYVYNGVKQWYDGKSFDFTDYYLSSYSLPTSFPSNTHKFLTYAPRVQYIQDGEYSTLAGFNMNQHGVLTGTTYDTYSQPVYSALFEFFDIGGTLLSSATTYNVLSACGQYFDCTNVTGNTINKDKHIFEYVGTGTKNIEDMGVTIPTDWSYYRVSFEGTSYTCNEWNLVNNSEFDVDNITYTSCEDGLETVLNLGPGTQTQICARGSFTIGGNTTKTLLGDCTTWGGEEQCFSTTRISEYFYYYKDPECGPGNKRVMFLNSFGTWDYFTFKYRDNVGYDIQRETYTQEPTLYQNGWDNGDYYGWNQKTGVFKQNISKTGLLYSGRISKSYLAWLSEELLKSPSVYIVDEDGDMQPIVLTNTEVIEPNFQRNDGEYELRLEYSGGYKETRQDKE